MDDYTPILKDENDEVLQFKNSEARSETDGESVDGVFYSELQA